MNDESSGERRINNLGRQNFPLPTTTEVLQVSGKLDSY